MDLPRSLKTFLMVVMALICAGAGPPPEPGGAVPVRARGSSLEVDLTGTMALLDAAACTVTLLDRGGVVRAQTGGAGWGDDHLDAPAGLWARNGIDVFVADYGNHRVQRYDRGLAYVATFSTRETGAPNERFGYPLDVAMSRLGDLFILDGENRRVLKVNGFSAVERTFGDFDAGEGRLLLPRRLDVGPDDRVYVLDGDRVLIFDSFGNYLGLPVLPDDGPVQAIFADDRGLVVAVERALLWFDESDRPGGRVAAESITGTTTLGAVDIAAGTDTMYVLTGIGVYRFVDPRRPARLDKQGKSQ